MTAAFSFTLGSTDGRARRGVVHTPHGDVQTPCFMPVGTQGAVKALTQDQLEAAGAEIILGNTYHLHLRPGEDVVARRGGLHAFAGWRRPILTDSGGFQVFSLGQLNRVTDDGVHFQSHVDGRALFLGPREATRIQEALGADIIMAFDECPPYPVTPERARAAVERTVAWAKLCQEEKRRNDVALFLIGQGSFDRALRLECMRRLVELDAPGYAIGGVSVGEEQALSREIVDVCAPEMPVDKPRYLMGVGTPVDLLENIAFGIDMFDCVMPTRNARNGMAFTRDGGLTIKNNRYREDDAPLDAACGCPACRRHSRAYLRHLYLAKEIGAVVYLSLHNVYFYLDLMRQARAAIERGDYAAFAAGWLARYRAGEAD